MFDLGLAAAILILVLLISLSPLVAVPIGMVLAMYALTVDQPMLQAAAIGAVGVTAARLVLALRTRRGRPGNLSPAAQAQQDALRQWLGRSRSYGITTFWAGALPVLPANFVFPLLATMRAPLHFALLGSLVGQLPTLLVTTWIFTTIAQALTPGSDEAATLLGIVAMLLIVRKLLDAVDWHHLRSEHRLRTRQEAADPRLRVFMPGWPPGEATGDTSTRLGDPDDRPDTDLEIEGEVVSEEEEDDEQPPRRPRLQPPLEGDSPPDTSPDDPPSGSAL